MLKDYNLFSFHHRLVFRISLFTHKILFQAGSPKLLKEWLTLKQTHTSIKLRSNNVRSFLTIRSHSKFGDLHFSNFFSNFLNKLNFNNFDPSFEKFKNDRIKNGKIYEDLNILLKNFPKFDCDLNFKFLIFLISVITFIFIVYFFFDARLSTLSCIGYAFRHMS